MLGEEFLVEKVAEVKEVYPKVVFWHRLGLPRRQFGRGSG
jgi:hypothetical protein